MKYIICIFFYLTLLFGCRSAEIFKPNTIIGNQQIQMRSDYHYFSKNRKPRLRRKHKEGNITYGYVFKDYIKNIFISQNAVTFRIDTNEVAAYNLIVYSKKGELRNFSSSPGKIGDRHFGKFQIEFNRGRISCMYYLDSIGRASGPMLFFKRNGKIKHVIVADTAGYCKEVYFTNKPRHLNEDTSFLSGLRYHAKRNQLLYDSIYSKPSNPSY